MTDLTAELTGGPAAGPARGGTVAALGERARVAGYALAGVRTAVAETPEQVRDAWAALPADVVLVLLTQAAADALEPMLGLPAWSRMTVVLP